MSRKGRKRRREKKEKEEKRRGIHRERSGQGRGVEAS